MNPRQTCDGPARCTPCARSLTGTQLQYSLRSLVFEQPAASGFLFLANFRIIFLNITHSGDAGRID